MGGKSAPEAPDYTAAAQQTAASNRASMDAQTTANRPTQNTPFGSSTWSSSESFDEAAYNRALQDWQARNQIVPGSPAGQMRRLGGATGEVDMGSMPTRNDYYTTNWEQNTTLDPELQGALDSQLDLQRNRSGLANSLFPRAQDEFGSPMDWSGFTPYGANPQQGLTPFSFGPGAQSYSPEQIQRGIGPSQGYVQNAGDAIYNQWSNRQEPLMGRQSEQLDLKLRNQGLRPGDQAYDDAINDLRNQQSDSRLMANYQATIGAGAEGSRLQGMDLNAGNFANQASAQALGQQFGIGDRAFGQGQSQAAMINALRGQQFGENMGASGYQNQLRQQQIAEQMQRRGFSLNEINAIISGQQVGMPSMPNFNAAGNSGGTNYFGAAGQQYQSGLDAFNAEQGAWGNLMGGISGITGAAFPFGF